MAAGAGEVIKGDLREASSPGLQSAQTATVVFALLVYAALMAIPFCPGIELGLALLLLGGPEIAPAVYLATVAALLLAFAIGRSISPRPLIEFLALLRLRRASEMLQRVATLAAEDRLQLLLARGRPQMVRLLTRHRYVALAIALNTPGNVLLGDGGGIALAAGVSRLFSLRGFAVTVALAVAPVPAIVMLAGS